MDGPVQPPGELPGPVSLVWNHLDIALPTLEAPFDNDYKERLVGMLPAGRLRIANEKFEAVLSCTTTCSHRPELSALLVHSILALHAFTPAW